MVGFMVLAQRKVLLLAADDFEDMELLYPLYRLAEEDVGVTVAGLDDHPVRGKKGHGPVPRRTKSPREASRPLSRIPVIRWPGRMDERFIRIGRPAGFNRLQVMDIAHGFWKYT